MYEFNFKYNLEKIYFKIKQMNVNYLEKKQSF